MIYKGEIIMFQGIKKLFGSKKEKEQILAPVAGQAVISRPPIKLMISTPRSSISPSSALISGT